MKKFILAVALCAASTFTFAQQGVMEIGGSLGINTNNTKESYEDESITTGKTFGFTILPTFMYYMTDNLAIGGKIGVDYAKNNNYDDYGEKLGNTKTTLFEIVPTIRYKKELGANFSWTPEFYIGFGFGNSKNCPEHGDEATTDLFALGTGINIARFEYAATDKWVISACFGSLDYNFTKGSIEDVDTKNNKFGLNVFKNSSIGIAYRF